MAFYVPLNGMLVNKTWLFKVLLDGMLSHKIWPHILPSDCIIAHISQPHIVVHTIKCGILIHGFSVLHANNTALPRIGTYGTL